MNRTLQEITAEIFRQDQWGQTARYIPELAEVDPRQFAVSVCLNDGRVLSEELWLSELGLLRSFCP